MAITNHPYLLVTEIVHHILSRIDNIIEFVQVFNCRVNTNAAFDVFTYCGYIIRITYGCTTTNAFDRMTNVQTFLTFEPGNSHPKFKLVKILLSHQSTLMTLKTIPSYSVIRINVDIKIQMIFHISANRTSFTSKFNTRNPA